MRRREFITLLGGAAAAWPPAARAQQTERLRRIGVLMPWAEGDPEARPRVAAFQQGLQELGWIDGRNVRIDYRLAGGDPGQFRKFADELLALTPDVILAASTPSVVALQQATRTVPIVFVGITDPVGAVMAFARTPNGGLIVTSSPSLAVHRDLIIALAARSRLPAVYPYRYFVTSGGLISYAPDLVDQHRRGASYIDRILKGEKPADL